MDIKFQENEPLSKHCTFGVGGPARYFYELRDIDEFAHVIAAAKKMGLPYFVYGGGSNVLFPDEGLDAVVVKIEASDLKIDGEMVEADSGVKMSQIENFGALRTIPGTVGGAIWGNAETMGISISDIILKVFIYDPKTDSIKTLNRDELGFGYRESRFKKNNEIILKGFFRVPVQNNETFQTGLKFRQKNQPSGLCAGSFFKNPLPDKPAGYLIDKAGLKGHKIGGAQISEQHANFIINTGGATAKDIIDLSELAKKEVKKQFGIDLQEEVYIVQSQNLTH